jgi:hypothetical protein
MSPDELAFWFIFQEKGGVPNLFAREFPFYQVPYRTLLGDKVSDEARAEIRDAVSQPTELFHKGRSEALAAKQLFVLYGQVYEPGEPWFPLEPIGAFSDDDFNPYWLNGGLR